MKRLLLFVACLLLLLPSLVWATASSCAETEACYSGVCIRTLTWVAGSDHSWTNYVLGSGASNTVGPIVGVIFRITTDPGSPAPTDNYGVTLLDSTSVDVLGGACLLRDTSNTESAVPLVGTTPWPMPVAGRLTLVISDNLVNSAAGVIYIYYVKGRPYFPMYGWHPY